MKTQWTSHLSEPEDKVRFEQHVNNSKAVLERLTEIIEAQERGIERNDTNASLYAQPGWEGYLAYNNGRKSMANTIKDLINLDQHIIRPGE